jgi:hypothetical protein
MNQLILCPACKCALHFDSSIHGDSGVCPACLNPILAKEIADAGPEPISAFSEHPQSFSKTLLSLADYLASLKDECQVLAARYNIDLKESFPTEFVSKQDAHNQYLEARKALPEVPPYRTPNMLPASALVWLSLGAIIAIPAALATELAASCLGAAVVALSAHVLQNYTGGGVVVAAFLLFLGFIAPFIAGGWTCAWVIAKFGRRGKNRNRWVAAFLASAIAGTTVLILWAFHLKFGREPFRAWDPFKMGPNLDVFTKLFFGMNFLVAMASGFRFADRRIRKQRFCEECHEFMNPMVVLNLRAGAIKTMVLALVRGSIPLAASLFFGESGNDGTASLSRCPACGAGFLEVTASMIMVNKNWQCYPPSWQVVSMNLNKQEANWFAV